MNSSEKLGRAFLLVIAILGWSAVTLQIFLTTRMVMDAGLSLMDGIVKTLSYFTVLTNILVAIVATASVLRGNSDTFLTRPSTMSATAHYIFVVGLIYSLVLRALWDPTGLQLAADIALHDLIPILYVLYWLIYVPKGTLRWIQPVYWLIYPFAYITYTLIRGSFGAQYPYPFVDVSALGYPAAFANIAMLFAMFLGLGLIAVVLDRLIGRFRSREITRSSN